MFKYKPNPEEVELNLAISAVHEYMTSYPPSSPEYATAADQLVKLYEQKDHLPSSRISPDALAAMIANLAGISMIVFHERANVIAGKAITFVRKLKD